MILWTLPILAIFACFQDVHTFSSGNSETYLSSCGLDGICKSEHIESVKKIEQSEATFSGVEIINPMENEGTAIETDDVNCPDLENADSLSDTELINRLTAPCRYDRLERPSIVLEDGSPGPVDVNVHVFIYFMQGVDSEMLRLRLYGLIQMRYLDNRLAFEQYAPNRSQSILGKSKLRDLIWIPHVFLVNGEESSILGTNEKDILTSISPNGTVLLSIRLKATFYCQMNLKKYPMDEQYCVTLLESWKYNSSELVLHWEQNLPHTPAPQYQLTTYSLVKTWSEETTVIADENNLSHGVFPGNYSALRLTVHLRRNNRGLFLSYYIPSIFIVAVSFISYWMQPGESSPRNSMNTTTLISFVTLSVNKNKSLTTLSPINLSDIWALTCILFIFGALIEFAFVNKIWNRRRNVVLKKVNSMNILKTTMIPRGHKLGGLPRGASCSNLGTSAEHSTESNGEDGGQNKNWASMTPQEVALWIDGKARLFCPLAFLTFNVIFWTLVFVL